MAEPVRVRRLTDQEEQKQQQIVPRGSTNSLRWQRAMMLLASVGGNSVPVIAQLVRADEGTMRDVIHWFHEIGLACMDPQWAGGRPRLLSDEDEDFVIQTATTRPTKPGQPFTRWSVRKLAACLRRVHGRVIRIGREALRCLLRRRCITFQHTKTWKESPGPDCDAKLDRVEHVSGASPGPGLRPRRVRAARDPADRRFLLGEAGQARPAAGDLPPHPRRHLLPRLLLRRRRPVVGRQPPPQRHRQQPGHADRQQPGHAEVDPRRPPRRRPDLHHPGQPLRPYRTGHSSLGGEEQGRAVLHPDLCLLGQPDRGPLRPAAAVHPARSNHRSHPAQTRALYRYLRWRNANSRHPEVLAAQRRERPRICGEKVLRGGGRPLEPAT